MAGFDEVFDFVVVGSGGGSMCSGLVMRQHDKSVLILEKTEFVGGTTARSGGVMWIPNNRFMKRDGVEDSFEKAESYLDSVVGDPNDAPGTSRERRRRYLNEAPQMVDFLVDQGIKLTRASYWPDYYDDRPGGSEAGRTVVAELFDVNELGAWMKKLRPGMMASAGDPAAYVEEGMKLRNLKVSSAAKATMLKIGLRTLRAKLTGKHYVTAGAALQGRMLQAALKAGVEIRTDSPVGELIVEDGAVKGVRTVKDGQPWQVGARLGVLVNAGGFARNQQMRDQYQPGTQAAWSNVPEGDTGEMIREMMRLGAGVGQMEEMVGYQSSIAPGTENDPVKPGVQSALASPHAILVDQTGVRYQNEGGSYMAFCRGMLERNKTVPAVPSWGVFDSQYLLRYGVPGTMVGNRAGRRWIEQGFIRKADGLEALAKLIEVEPAMLKATIERFNGFVAKGRDEDFQRGDRAYDRWLGDPVHRPSPTLGAIAEGPFYAMPVVPGDVSTYGGVVTDVNARVVREDGSVIPGLYATGVSTASVMGRAYPGAGASVGPSFTWGFIAAKHALQGEAAAEPSRAA
ncbi:FAD-dependent oxidoreductase [Phenylobacterium sp. LjRoot219]|uniref:FAD-dependent oxidoreductase n=1 Tax=Phenylobacterium sp. LjRoot219 TaxID=3342283 RepID=UPI003ED11F50